MRYNILGFGLNGFFCGGAQWSPEPRFEYAFPFSDDDDFQNAYECETEPPEVPGVKRRAGFQKGRPLMEESGDDGLGPSKRRKIGF